MRVPLNTALHYIYTVGASLALARTEREETIRIR